jgi:hypothetical protein
LIVIDIIELDGLQFTLEQNINKVNLTQLLSNVEKQDENNISASVFILKVRRILDFNKINIKALV